MRRVNARTKTGCLPCRRRKKKCDEAKPQCRACERNKLECAWPPHIVRIFGLDAEQIQNSDDLHAREELRSPIEAQSRANTPLLIPSAASASKDPIATLEGAEHHTGERDDCVISWSLESESFVSTIRAGMLLPNSPILLSHYLEVTAPKLAPVPAPDVPWVSWILPVAFNDDLLMNAILALSGGHLLYKQPDNQEIHHATYRHYSTAVQSLYQVFNDGSTLSEPLALLRVALTILILFHYEVVSGNLDGSPFFHLRATRQLVLNLRTKSRQNMSAAEQKLYGFVMEVYSYIVLCNSITPFGMNCNRTLIYDSFLQTLDDLQDLGAFGVMFSGGHHFFELISSVALLATKDPNLDRHEEYMRLKARVGALESPVLEESDSLSRPGCTATLEVCRIALLTFLETANSPFSKYDTTRIQQLQPLLDVAVLNLPQILPSTYSCILMWPIMIIGSCLVEEDQRAVISHMLLHNQYWMKNTAQASMLFELLWNDPDEHAFGPYGLGLLMNRHNLDYGVI
ncbi:fungal-specific transcription factor domain-containing protein [Aspergillus floccosus]